jgi:hypothetical protein
MLLQRLSRLFAATTSVLDELNCGDASQRTSNHSSTAQLLLLAFYTPTNHHLRDKRDADSYSDCFAITAVHRHYGEPGSAAVLLELPEHAGHLGLHRSRTHG